MAEELAPILTVVATMLIFSFIGFSFKSNTWLKGLFFLLSILMVPVLLFISMTVARLNGLGILASILERIYGALLIVYVFIVAMFVIKFIIMMFNLFKVNREEGVRSDVEDI